MPFAFFGLVALSEYDDPPLPDPAANGSGDEITLLLFSDAGEPAGEARVKKIRKTEDEWRKQLSSAEFAVTREAGTEPPYTGRYARHHEKGLYRCVGCGNTLFRSSEMFDSGTGWPSFWAPAARLNVTRRTDRSFLLERVGDPAARSAMPISAMFSATVPRRRGSATASTPPPFGL